ncbi:MAG: GNAT family N-acetyltransferase [Steroidobacteraceae bacterium]
MAADTPASVADQPAGAATGTPQLRTLGPDDEAAYRALWSDALATRAECFRSAPGDEDEPAGIPTRGDAESFTLGAFLDGRLVGITSLARERGGKLRHKAQLWRMFVRPDAVGHGVGRALMQETIRRAAAMPGLRQIWLNVLETNQEAQQLYAAAGFRGYAHEPEAVQVGERFVAELQMVRFLRRDSRD